jgi:hypothetical protein
VAELAKRQPPPLALIGGGSSDRARDLAQALAGQKSWQGAPPLLLISTATADNIYPGDVDPLPESLMTIYPGRTYRFCFTNSQMAEAMWDFIWSQEDLRPASRPNPLPPGLPAGISQAAAGDLWGSLAFFMAEPPDPPPPLVHIVEWLDDPYSRDLAHQFRKVLAEPPNPPLSLTSFSVPYSVGDFWTPNPREAFVIQTMARFMPATPEDRSLLILPAVDKPARRFLRWLATAAPREIGNLVVVTGDSIAFNTLYRDRQTAWNIQELPVPVIAFCHQNPVAWEETAGTASPSSLTGTDDELLNADIVRTVVESAFGLEGTSRGQPVVTGPVLLASSDELNAQIKRRRARYFAPDGNRRGGSGEYLVSLRPRIVEGRPQATLEVWRRRIEGPAHRFWERIQKLEPDYNDRREGGGAAHGGL